MRIEEAHQILNVGREAAIDDAYSAFQRLFLMNDPKKGGSLYLQSKVVRAMEAIQDNLRASSLNGSKN